MTVPEMDEETRQQLELVSRQEMERLAAHLKDLILSHPPEDLLGYIYGQRLLSSMFARDADSTDDDPNLNVKKRLEHSELINDHQFVLEYVHAVLSSFEPNQTVQFTEPVYADIFETAETLRSAALMHCMISSLGSKDGIFGPQTGMIEVAAKTNWVALRGNRYPVLEEEFFAFVLAPHDHALRQAYGVGSQEIAAGFQAIADSIRTGHAQATDQIEQQMEAAQVFAAERNLTPEHSTDLWTKEHPECLAAALESYNDLLRGGICNLSKHSGLPSAFLEDLSWHRGEEQDFFAPGPYCGTPLRTLPARKKPLVKIGEDYFAIDPCFARDSGYRALLWNLLQRKPGYRKEFEINQKQMSEAAFSRVLADQLVGAKVHQEVWHKDSETGH